MKDVLTLYHFTKIENIGDILGKGRLKLTEVGLSNDPFEMSPSFHVKEIDPIQMDGHMWNLERNWEYHKSMEPQTVICLSACVSSVLMWGHYAANHSGVCLAFDIPVLEYDNCLIANLEQKYPLLPMQYGTSRIFARDYVELDERNTIVYSLGCLLRKLLSYKPLAWNYEREFRLLVPQNAVDYDSGMLFTSILKKYLSGVILGSQCPMSESKVRALLSSSGFGAEISVEKASLHPQSHTVEVKGNNKFSDLIEYRYEYYKKLESLYSDKEQILTLQVVHPRNERELYNEIN